MTDEQGHAAKISITTLATSNDAPLLKYMNKWTKSEITRRFMVICCDGIRSKDTRISHTFSQLTYTDLELSEFISSCIKERVLNLYQTMTFKNYMNTLFLRLADE